MISEKLARKMGRASSRKRVVKLPEQISLAIDDAMKFPEFSVNCDPLVSFESAEEDVTPNR